MSEGNRELRLSAFIDGELSPSEQAEVANQVANETEVQTHVAGLREVDRMLRSEIVRPNFNVEDFLRRLESVQIDRQVETTPIAESATRSRFVIGISLLLAATVLLGLGIMNRFPQQPDGVTVPVTSVAQIVRSVGNVEFKPTTDSPWEPYTQMQSRSLGPGAAIRTSMGSLCEISTAQSGILRLNQDSELVVHRPNDVELIRGEFWCQAGTNELKIRAPQPAEPTTNRDVPQLFVCPQESSTQCWLEQQTLRCGAVSNKELTLQLPDLSHCTLEAGQWVAMAMTTGPTAIERGQFDPVHAAAWQLPLLVQRPAEDSELQSLLSTMLGQLGQSKMQHLYETQIRSLGPTGAVPLVAFVKSPESRAEPELRHQAMRIVADLAPESSRADLFALAQDLDATVAQYAAQALARLDLMSPKSKA
ncbi:MAG: hypothetical protein Q8M16_07850 [Pirellulaceae bacterium]|nr:hypothetical protein [Pirellulaceae bacterium]